MPQTGRGPPDDCPAPPGTDNKSPQVLPGIMLPHLFGVHYIRQVRAPEQVFLLGFDRHGHMLDAFIATAGAFVGREVQAAGVVVTAGCPEGIFVRDANDGGEAVAHDRVKRMMFFVYFHFLPFTGTQLVSSGYTDKKCHSQVPSFLRNLTVYQALPSWSTLAILTGRLRAMIFRYVRTV